MNARRVRVFDQDLWVLTKPGAKDRPPLLLFNGIGANIELAAPFMRAMGDVETIIFDVPGDIVCGGFAVPITKGMVRDAYIITSGEYMPLYAANNICRGLRTQKAPLSGIICNAREAENEKEIVERFATALGVPMLAHIPHERLVQQCERAGKSVIEGSPGSAMAFVYRGLAERILTEKDKKVPESLEDEYLRELTQA